MTDRTRKEINRVEKLGAVIEEKNGCACYKWNDGSFAIQWHNADFTATIPAASYNRLGL